MSIYLKEIRQFYDRLYRNNVQFNDNIAQNFINQNQKISNQIHNDMRRVWRFKPLFENITSSDEVLTNCRALQCIFEKYVFIIWSNMQTEIQENYYQSVTDILEMIFCAYVNFKSVCRDVHQFSYFSEELRLFDGDISVYFKNQNYERSVSVGMQSVSHLFKQTQFSEQSFLKMSASVHKQVSQLSPQLAKSIPKSFSSELLVSNYLQYVTSFCLHFATDLKLSSILAQLYSVLNLDGQIYFISQIIVFCANSFKDQIQDGFELINQCVQKMMVQKTEELYVFIRGMSQKMFFV
ncbi:Conserved_hypothetical protein [Hexamita inflata]|uniref:Uncharacterized protein n=1 Tax=Hexamita inflata TaxID=28002 RepID=A0AA86QQX3_9EUKA|nr:Conserved hypothetical protein [Hexamita inflata]